MIEKIIIAALSENNVIGKDNSLPWNISEDLKRFKKLTNNNAIVMGRKTYESVGRPLPNRYNLVLSKGGLIIPGTSVVDSLESAYLDASNNGYDKIFVCGGASVYEEALKDADRMFLTRVHDKIVGDTYFPEVNWNEWKLVNEDNQGSYSFLDYLRK